MKDYADNVSATLQDSAAAATFSLPVLRAETAAANSKTLTLREDWRLSSDLDLAVPAETALTINGAGHHVYEMGGRLLNSGAGTVTFVNGTTLYPAGNATEGVTVNGIWDSEESNALMATRQTGSSGGGSSSGGSGSSGTQTETTTNPDGSTTTTVTRPDGSTTETTKNPDGSTEVIETKKDGTVTTTTTDKDGNKTVVTENTDGTSETTITNTNGTTSTTKTDADGKTETVVKLPSSIVADAADKGETVALPMPEVTATSESAPTITVDLSGSQSAKVEIPVAGVTSGTVAVIVGEDGEETIVMNSIPTENGVVVTLADGDMIKVIDNSKDFADVPDSYWGADAVDFATSRELFNGTSETAFTPDGAMNRAMIVTVLARLEGVDTSTGDTWYDVGRDWAMEAGISDGSNMDGTLTREQLATILYRYAQSKGYDVSIGEETNILSYVDALDISEYAIPAMQWACGTGIMEGADGRLSPQDEATRVQVATMLMRFITTIA